MFHVDRQIVFSTTISPSPNISREPASQPWDKTERASLLQAAWGQGRANSLLEEASALSEDITPAWEDDARKCKARSHCKNSVGTSPISRHSEL